MYMKTRVKGNRIRQMVIKHLESKGFEVAIVERTGRFIFPKDMFGLFDLVAIDEIGVSFVQVSTNTPHTHKNFVEFIKKYPHMSGDIFQFVWIDNKGFNIFQYTIDNYEEVGKYVKVNTI